MPPKAKYCHEAALRIVLSCIEGHANRHRRYIVPMLSVRVDLQPEAPNPKPPTRSPQPEAPNPRLNPSPRLNPNPNPNPNRSPNPKPNPSPNTPGPKTLVLGPIRCTPTNPNPNPNQVHINFYVRLFVRVYTSPAEVTKSSDQVAL